MLSTTIRSVSATFELRMMVVTSAHITLTRMECITEDTPQPKMGTSTRTRHIGATS